MTVYRVRTIPAEEKEKSAWLADFYNPMDAHDYAERLNKAFQDTPWVPYCQIEEAEACAR